MNAQLKPLPRFAREGGLFVIDEIKPLLEAHWLEIAHYQDIPVKCDYGSYLKLEANGLLRIYTVRNSNLIGYAIFVVAKSLHYNDSLQARQDVLYLAPEFRRGRIGIRFIDWCDEQLKAEGVQVVYHHVKDAAPALGILLARRGYTLVDHIYAKRLDRGV